MSSSSVDVELAAGPRVTTSESMRCSSCLSWYSVDILPSSSSILWLSRWQPSQPGEVSGAMSRWGRWRFSFFGFDVSVGGFSEPFPSCITQLEFSPRGDLGLLGLHRLCKVDWALQELSLLISGLFSLVSFTFSPCWIVSTGLLEVVSTCFSPLAISILPN